MKRKDRILPMAKTGVNYFHKYQVPVNNERTVRIDPILNFFNGGFLMPAEEGGSINFPSQLGYRPQRLVNGGDISIADLITPNWITKYANGGEDPKPTDNIDFLKKMANSPLFAQRYAAMTGKPLNTIDQKEIDDYRSYILNNLSTVKYAPIGEAPLNEPFDDDALGVYYSPGDIKKRHSDWLSKVKTLEQQLPNLSKKQREIVQDQINKLKQQKQKSYEDDLTKVHKIFMKFDSPKTKLHEESHASTEGPYGLKFGAIPFKYDPSRLASPFREEFEKSREYLTIPTEQKARRDVLAKYMMDQGLWDPINKSFTKENLDALKLSVKDLLRKERDKPGSVTESEMQIIGTGIDTIYPYSSDEELIRMFNSFVKAPSKQGLPKAQRGVLKQRYSTGPMMGDLATQSGVPTQGEVARQDQLRKEQEIRRQQDAARKKQQQATSWVNKQSYIKAQDMSPEAVRIREQAAANYRRQQAIQNSALAQSFGSLTPGGYNPGAGAIGAETFLNMNPITGPGMSASRLTQFGLGENPYGFGNGFGSNVLGTLGLVGDIAGVGSIKALPGSSGIRNIPRQTITFLDKQLSPVGRTLDRIQKEGKLAGLSDWEIASQQMNKVGITSNQRQAYVPGVSQLLTKYVTPYGYAGFNGGSKLSQIWANIKKGGVGVAPFDDSRVSPFGIGKDIISTQRSDAWRLYLGLPQRYKTFRMAETSPVRHHSYTPEQLKKMDIYSINNAAQDRNIKLDLDANNNISTFDLEQSMKKLRDDVTYTDQQEIMGGFNTRLNKYGLEYNDIWDLNVPIAYRRFLPKKYREDYRTLYQSPILSKILTKPSVDGTRELRVFNIPVDKVIGKPFMSHEVLPYNSQMHVDALKNYFINRGKFFEAKNPQLFAPTIQQFQRNLKDLENYPIRKEGGIVKDNMGYWNPKNWGKVVQINSNKITMKGVDQPLVGVSNTGDVKYMQPGRDYNFDGTTVTEYPMSTWLSKYQLPKAQTGITQDQKSAILNWVKTNTTPTVKQPITAQQFNQIVAKNPKRIFATNTREVYEANRKEKYGEQWEAEKREAQRLKEERKAAAKTREAVIGGDKNATFTFPDGTTKKWKDMNWREQAYVSGKNMGSWNNDNWTDWINPIAMIGSLGEGLATAPYEAKQSNSYLPYIYGIGVPLLTGGLGGLGAKTTGQFVENVVNPLPVNLSQLGKKPTQQFGNLVEKVDPETGVSTFVKPAAPANVTQLWNKYIRGYDDSVKSIDDLRRIYHNSERIMMPEEIRRLRHEGYGNASDYYNPDAWRNQSFTTLSQENTDEILRIADQNYSTALRKQYAIPQEQIEQINTFDDIDRIIDNWAEQNQFELTSNPELLQRLQSSVGDRYNININKIPDNQNQEQYISSIIQSPAQRQQFYRDFAQEFSNNLTRQDIDRYRAAYQNRITPQPRTVTNKSGMERDAAMNVASEKDKAKLATMTDDEFRNTVVKPNGDVVPYYEGSLENYFSGSENVIAISPTEYVERFNANIDILNDIINNKNKTGIQYRVKGLDEHGNLVFETPEQTIPRVLSNKQKTDLEWYNRDAEDFAVNKYGLKQQSDGTWTFENNPHVLVGDRYSTKEDAMKYLKDQIDKLYIKPQTIKGETSWTTRINPGEWRGTVQDVPNTLYYRSIPGLEMANTTSSVFADHLGRKGSGAYEAINEYLKKLDLGRVKPGFNSQTESSRSAWQNFINSGRARGFYGNSKTLYGSMYQHGGTEDKSNTPGLTPREMEEWNRLIDFASEKGLSGSKTLDNKSQNLGKSLFDQYRQAYPDTVITYDIIPRAQREFLEFQKNNQRFKDERGIQRKDQFNRLSKPDAWFGSITSQQKFIPMIERVVDESGREVSRIDLGLMNREGIPSSRRNASGSLKGFIPPSGAKIETWSDGKNYIIDPSSGDAVEVGQFVKQGNRFLRRGGDVAIYGRRNYTADTPSFYKSGGSTSSWLKKYQPGGTTNDTVLSDKKVGEIYQDVKQLNLRPTFPNNYYERLRVEDPNCPEGVGCSYQATRGAMSITGLPFASYAPADAGYRDAVAERYGLQNIFDQTGAQRRDANSRAKDWRYPTNNDFKTWKAGDIVVLDQGTETDLQFLYDAPPGFSSKDMTRSSHNGVIVGFTSTGQPVIQHGFATGKNKGVRLTEVLGKDNRVTDLGHGRYAIKSVWRPKEINEKGAVTSITPIIDKGVEQARRKQETTSPTKFSLNPTYEEKLQRNLPVAAAFSGADTRLDIKRDLVNMFNDKDLDKQIQYKLGITAQTLQNLKPVVFGIAGQESSFGVMGHPLAGGKELIADVISSNPSKGLFQIKYDSLTENEKKALGINSAKDLLDNKKAYMAAIALMYNAKRRMDAEVEQGTHPELKDKDPYFRAAYYYNSPARAISTAKEWGRGSNPVVLYNPTTWLNKFVTRERPHIWSSIDPNYAEKAELRMDAGSYPYKLMQKAKDLNMDVDLDAESQLEEVVIRSVPKGKTLKKFNK